MNQPEHSQRRAGKAMIYIAWILALGLLALFFQNWLDRQENPNRDLAATHADGLREVVLKRNRGGHYVAPGFINGEPVTFLLDTGATTVSVPVAIADRLGLKRGAPLRTMTANGEITVFAAVADEIRLGDIVQREVRATINPYMDDDVVLLGMSFMQHLELIQRGGELTLRQL